MPIFICHLVQKPFLIYQIGSADPKPAVQGAKTVQQVVARFDFNCGCPTPLPTHSGAALEPRPPALDPHGVVVLEAATRSGNCGATTRAR